MRLHRDTFESQKIERDTSFSFKVIDNNNPLHIRDNISDIKFICKSISKELLVWEGKPALDISRRKIKLYIFITIILSQKISTKLLVGDGVQRYSHSDWINKVHQLPTDNSIIFGGTYIQKNLNLPPTTASFSYTINPYLIFILNKIGLDSITEIPVGGKFKFF